MVDKISKSEQKRIFKQVEELAKELSELGENEVKSLPAEEEVRENISACRGLKGGALKRQVKYLAKVLRQSSLQEIYAFLQKRKGSDLKDKQLFHRAERWRDVLINEALEVQGAYLQENLFMDLDYESSLLEEIALEIPSIDGIDLRKVVFAYAKTRNKTQYREIFRIIKAAIDAEEREIEK